NDPDAYLGNTDNENQYRAFNRSVGSYGLSMARRQGHVAPGWFAPNAPTYGSGMDSFWKRRPSSYGRNALRGGNARQGTGVARDHLQHVASIYRGWAPAAGRSRRLQGLFRHQRDGASSLLRRGRGSGV